MTRIASSLRSLILGAALVTGAMSFAPAAFAAGTAPAEATPSETTATFGSWTVRCRPATDGGNKLCEMVQAIPASSGNGVIANLALGHLPGDQSLHMLVQVPLSVSLTEPVDIQLPDGKSSKATFETCYPNLCLAQAEIGDDVLGAFKTDDTMTIAFKDRAKKAVSVKASLSGFNQAYAAMATE